MSTKNNKDFKRILRRLKYALNLETDKEAAALLGVTPAVLSNWIHRPTDKGVTAVRNRLCGRNDLEWILSGNDLPCKGADLLQALNKAFVQLPEADKYQVVADVIRKAETRNVHAVKELKVFYNKACAIM